MVNKLRMNWSRIEDTSLSWTSYFLIYFIYSVYSDFLKSEFLKYKTSNDWSVQFVKMTRPWSMAERLKSCRDRAVKLMLLVFDKISLYEWIDHIVRNTYFCFRTTLLALSCSITHGLLVSVLVSVFGFTTWDRRSHPWHQIKYDIVTCRTRR